jgi:glc operon protein GlcG
MMVSREVGLALVVTGIVIGIVMRGREMATETEMWTTRPTLSGESSRRMVAAAVDEAVAMSVRVTVVAVDESGVLKELYRMDGAPLVSVQTAWNKAYAAAAIGMPPDDFYAAIKSDAAAVASFATRPGLALIAGGIPVVTDDGRVAGAIGVAGAMTGADDRRIAAAAVNRACR